MIINRRRWISSALLILSVLFYGGMVSSKNVLSVLMQCFAITSLVTVLWTLYGYTGNRFHDFSDDLRHHYAGTYSWRLRGTYEIFGTTLVYAPIAHWVVGLGPRASSILPVAQWSISMPVLPAW